MDGDLQGRFGPDQAAVAARLLEEAKRAGADCADVVVVSAEQLEVSARAGALNDVERSESVEFGLRAMLEDEGGLRAASVSASDAAPETLRTLAVRAVAMARETPPDPYAALAPLEQTVADPAAAARSLGLSDEGDDQSAESMLEDAIAVEAAALGVAGVTQCEAGSASWSRSGVLLATSNGFSGGYAARAYSYAVSAVAGSGVGMERDYAFTAARARSALRPLAEVGREAGERAVRRLDPKRPATGVYPVVFEPRTAMRLIGAVIGALSGAAIARGSSILGDKMGERLLPPGFDLVDDPLRPGGLGARPFDGEGIAGREKRLIKDGVISEWLLDLGAAKQLGLATNGSASRGVAGAPSPSSSNAWLTPGEKSFEALIADIGEGLLVTEMMGRGLNAVTGDFSSGASGFWIEKGEIAHPVSELTIAGRLFEMFESLSAANDLRFDHRVNAPSLRIEGMTVAAA